MARARRTSVRWPPNKRDLWSLKFLVRRYVKFVLRQTNQNKVLAAKILDIDLSTLYRWLAR